MPSHVIKGLRVETVAPTNQTGANVLCLHGICAGSWVFDDLLPMIAARGFGATALSFRGHPPNPPIAAIGGVRISDYAREAGVVARELDRPIVIGHSLGGLIALMLAGRNLIRAAVLVSPAPARGISVVSPSILMRMVAHLPSLAFSRPMLPSDRDFNSMVLNRVAPERRPAILRRFIADSGRVGREVAIGRYRIPARAVRIPLLVVGAEDDRFIPASVAQKVARKYGAAFHLARGHGHFLFAEPDWEAEARIMLDWIGALPRVVRHSAAERFAAAREPLLPRADS